MSTSDTCFLKYNCKKYKSSDCLCKIEDSMCIKLFKISELYKLSLISEDQYKHVNLMLDENGNDKEEYEWLYNVENDIVNFVNSGRNIYIYSTTTGNGKTAWSLRLLRSYINKIWYKCNIECKALFISVPRFLLEIKSNISEKSSYIQYITENISKADIVIWDDIACKTSTQFEHDNLLSLLEMRFNNNKCNIFTSNIEYDRLNEFLGDRISSRVVNYSFPIKFIGNDKRNLKYSSTNS